MTDLDLPHLKKVSLIKHRILNKYLPVWVKILGSQHPKLAYVDCYAGGGLYEFQGQESPGSPIIALQAAKEYLEKTEDAELVLIFVEKDQDSTRQLNQVVARHKPLPARLHLHVQEEDAKDFIGTLLERAPSIVPSFFMIDPYGHPLTIPIISDILGRSRTEALITFMYFRINMDASNPRAMPRVDQMFGHANWRAQPFLQMHGLERELGFLQYFVDQIKAKFKLVFRLRFDSEDKVTATRTKYYLIHASNHPKAALLMKEIMHPLGDEAGVFDYSGRAQASLFERKPKDDDLESFLRANYACQKIGYDVLREETWRQPFIDKEYRRVILLLEERQLADITRISSKKTGLRGNDLVHISRKK